MPFDSPWYAANELDRHRAMLAAFVAWRAATRHELTEVGTEVDLDGVIAEPADGLPGVRVRGRIDRLERDAQGRLVVVDVKTAKSPVTKDDAQHHAQLGLYQLAVSAGLLPDGDQPGGGRLVYVGKPTAAGGATEREQTALGAEDTEQWRETVRAAAAATAGPQFAARVNDGCSHCPIRPTCPRPHRAEHVMTLQPRRTGCGTGTSGAHRRAGRGDRRPARAAGGGRRRRGGQDRDHGRPGGVAGGQRVTPTRARCSG